MKVPVPSAVHVAPAADPKVFDKAFVMARLDTLWSLPQEFGQEKSPFDVYLVRTDTSARAYLKWF